MKTLDKGKDKIKKICEVLREETIEPAKKQGDEIVKEARKKAEKMLAEAQAGALKMIENARAEIEMMKNGFDASLSQAAKQSIESLKQAVENHLFNKNLASLVESSSADPHLVAALINAVIQALQKDGISADLSAIIPEKISPQAVNQLLLANVAKFLQKPLELGSFAGGAQVKLVDKKITIDISDRALRDLLATHVVRKEFRKLFFQ